MKEEKPYLYTNTEWEDLLEYNGMTWIGIDRFKAVQQENKSLQSQLKAKEEVIQNARLWINRKIKSCTIEATSTTTNDICKITLFSLNKLDEILSKGENK